MANAAPARIGGNLGHGRMGAKSTGKSTGRKGAGTSAARAAAAGRAHGESQAAAASPSETVRPAGPSATTASAPASEVSDLQARLVAIEQERDRLRAELDAALARIEDLERSRVEVVNRIDWVIDSLQSLIERRGTA